MAAEGQDLGGGAMFTEEELSEIAGLKLGEDYIEVTCGCTSRRYGDAVGRLQVFLSGDLQITCECTPGCPEGKNPLSLPPLLSLCLDYPFFSLHARDLSILLSCARELFDYTSL